jgi:5-methylthioadenosine/S-adenosylhomocysteine deaminase
MILIKNTTILTQNSQRQIIKNGAILINDEYILDIGLTKKLEKKYVNYVKKIINGQEKVALPGLINAHTHAAMTLLRGLADDMILMDWLTKKIWPRETKFKPGDIFNGTEIACKEMSQSGTTTFNNMYWYNEKEIHAVNSSGLRDFSGLLLLDAMNFTPIYIEKLFNQLKKKTNKKIKINIAPHSIYAVSEKNLIWAKKFADQNNLLLHIHLSETEKEVSDCLKIHKCRPVEYLEKIGFLGKNVIAAHGCWLSDAEIKILVKKKVSLAHCPTSNLKLASGIMPLSKLIKAGANVCLGTDGAASNNSLDMFSEMKIAALIHKWNEKNPVIADAQTVLDMATINGARALHMDNEIGSLSIGKKADIILLDFNQPHLKPCSSPISHLVYSARGADVDLTIIDGKIIK